MSTSMAWSKRFFLALWLGIIWTDCLARGIVVDDSASQALEPAVAMRWQHALPDHRRGAADNTMVGDTRIFVRLDMSRWLHRTVRLYLNLPSQPPGPIDMSWTAQGAFSSGQLHSGNRMLVYAGPVEQPMLGSLFSFRFSVNGALLNGNAAVSYQFEVDEE